MKISLHAFALCLIAPSAIAQIPNGGFENWTTTGSYMEPTGWLSTNPLTDMMGVAPSCEQGTFGFVGNFVKVTTRDLPGLGPMPGIVYPGDAATEVDGFPFTSRPAALNGQWTYVIMPGDMAMVLVVLSKWNPVTMERDEIGTGIASATGAQAGWQAFSAAITYVSADDPDTASIALMSSVGGGVTGSTLWVDELGFGTAMHVASVEDLPTLEVFPTPATDHITLRTAERHSEVVVLDLNGRVVRQVQANDMNTMLDLSGLQSGAYVALVRFADGRAVRHMFVKA